MDEKIIGIFRYESELRGKRNATLLMLVEITSTLYVYEQLLDVLNTTAEQTRHLTAGFDGDPMVRFEKLIQRLNDAVANFLQQEPTPIAWNRLNIFVMELSDEHVCLSGFGRLTNLFLQKQENGTYRRFDLFGSLEQPLEINPQKPFAALICGDIHPGDLLFAGTQNFDRLRDELQIVHRLGSLPAVSAAVEIQQDLEQRHIPDDFAGVVIANVPVPQGDGETLQEKIETESVSIEKSTQSIRKMFQDEEETEAMLSPTIAPVGKKKGLPKDWTQRAQNIWVSIVQAIQSRFKKQPVVKDPVTLASLRSLNAGHSVLMTNKRRWTLLVCAAVVFLAIVGTLWYRYAKQHAAEQTLWNMAYEQALDKKTRAEASLVYGNEVQARSLMNEASGIANSLDSKTKERQTNKEALQAGLQEVATKLKHEVHIDHPTELFASQVSGAETSLNSLLVLKGQIYVIETPETVEHINPTNKEVRSLAVHASSTMAVGTAGKDRLFFITPAKTMLTLEPSSGKVESVAFTSGQAKNLDHLSIYNGRLYALDSVSNMIWKYGASGTGFGGSAPYLKQNTTDLSSADALAIDSNIYVGFKNGKLIRYLSGAEEAWNPHPIDPPLNGIDGMWTSPDTDRLIIADATAKRVIVLRKDGQLISQIYSPEFKGPREVTADLTNKKIYILDGHRVLQLDLP